MIQQTLSAFRYDVKRPGGDDGPVVVVITDLTLLPVADEDGSPLMVPTGAVTLVLNPDDAKRLGRMLQGEQVPTVPVVRNLRDVGKLLG